MPAEIEIQLDADSRYPTDAESERTAIERGWKPAWGVLVDDGKTIPRYIGTYEDQDQALEIALAHAEAEGVRGVKLQETSAYLREQIAAEAAFEGRVG
jgi:hypothetical protein